MSSGRAAPPSEFVSLQWDPETQTFSVAVWLLRTYNVAYCESVPLPVGPETKALIAAAYNTAIARRAASELSAPQRPKLEDVDFNTLSPEDFNL